MPPSLLARSLEPLVAILWGIFLMWTGWTAAVWLLGIGPAWLGLAGDQAVPNAELRRAVLLLADHADVAWMALAVANLHLIITRAHGLRIARTWLGLTAGGAFLLGVVNGRLGLPFGWMAFGSSLGVRLAGVAIGWMLLWAVLIIGAREAVLRLQPRASHFHVALFSAAVVLLTMVNLEAPARFIRGWWVWHAGEAQSAAPMPWWTAVAWFGWPWLAALAIREKDVVSGVCTRSAKPALILACLNGIALAARLQMWLRG